ncbi:MAG: dTDP-4-dehydrorhamnose reductase [Candidatus Eremiobacteraeota bacterium]|nr:dTDP-4-dehydrorhamnose reductase [Candidatus Eremiobacteraeota bacterium]MBV8353848.1 dTDP-4-dehydrorhamnose reductase [Candidatus Eremiobacteraeota bacterium]
MGVSLERVAIIGARGQLGARLLEVFADCEPIALNRPALDVEDAEAIVEAVRRYRPSVVIDTAAFHDVGQCEQHPARAFAVNAVAVEHLGAACALAGATLVFISTDYVFDGQARAPYAEHDEPRPQTVYGISKRAGELLALRYPASYVVRTSGLFGPGGSRVKGPTFIERIIAQARRGEALRVVDDIVFSPSYAPDVARLIRAVLERGEPGIYHLTSEGACSWYEFARAALRIAGYSAPIAAVSHRAFDPSLRRPLYSALAHDALRRAGIQEPPSWLDALAVYVAAAGLGIESERRGVPEAGAR